MFPKLLLTIYEKFITLQNLKLKMGYKKLMKYNEYRDFRIVYLNITYFIPHLIIFVFYSYNDEK